MGATTPDMGVPVKSLPVLHVLHPITQELIYPIGFRKDGRPIWPVMGGDDTVPPPQSAPPAPAQPPVAAPPAVPGPLMGSYPYPPGFAPPTPYPYPYPTQPGPAPVPQPPAGQQPPVPGPPAQPPAPSATPPATPGQAPADPGFPANTPWREMNPEQQVAYWQHQSRRHEARVQAMSDYEQLKQTAAEYQRQQEANQSDHQRAVAEAHRQGAAEALQQANGQLVDQWVRAAAVNRLPAESVDALLAGLNRQAFVANGVVDTARVWDFVSSLAVAPGPTSPPPAAPAQAPAGPPPPQPVGPTGAPDFGQGQPPVSRPAGLEAGRLLAQQRFAKQNQTKPTILQ